MAWSPRDVAAMRRTVTGTLIYLCYPSPIDAEFHVELLRRIVCVLRNPGRAYPIDIRLGGWSINVEDRDPGFLVNPGREVSLRSHFRDLPSAKNANRLLPIGRELKQLLAISIATTRQA
jgi:hypothetical protein